MNAYTSNFAAASGRLAPMLSRTGRPFRITLLLVLVLITTALNFLRLITVIARWSALGGYLSQQELAYIAVTGAIWTFLGLYLLWIYRRGARHSRLLFLAAAILYAAWYWIDRLVAQATPAANGGFAAAMTALLLGFIAFVVLDPHNQPYFGRETHERKREDQRTT